MARRRDVSLSEVGVTIRRATVADAAAIAAIQVHGHRFAHAGILPQPLSEGRAFIAERDGRAIGFVTVGRSDEPTLPATAGKLLALYLEPDGSGVGRALLAHGEAAFDGMRKDYERDGALRHELRYRRALFSQ